LPQWNQPLISWTRTSKGFECHCRTVRKVPSPAHLGTGEIMIVDEASNDSHASQLQFAGSQTAAAKNQTSRNAKRADKAPKPIKATACVVFSSDLIGDASMNEAIQTSFVHYSMRSEVDAGEKFNFYSSPCDTVTSIRWTKQDLRRVSPSEVQHFEPYILQVLDNDIFIDLVLKSVNGFEFPQLGFHLEQLFQPHIRAYQRSRMADSDANDSADASSRSYCTEVPVTKVMALINLEPVILKAQRRLSKTPNENRPISELVDCATSFLLYEHKIEVTRCKKLVEFSEYLQTLTRLIDQRDYEQHATELDFVMKAQKEKLPEGLSLSQRENFELRQTWGAMLQMIPKVSKAKAQAFLQNEQYSCPRKVYDTFHSSADPLVAQLPLEQKKLLLQQQFGSGRSGVKKNEAKLSRHVYNLMTATDPDALISDI